MVVALRKPVESFELITLDTLTPAVVFAPGGVDDILAKIEGEVRGVHTDISTKAGRDAIASTAYKIARSKTALDDMGKALVADWKEKSKKVDAERKKLRDRLDVLKDEVRQPLTDWENAETARIEGHEAEIKRIEALAAFDNPEPSAETVRARLAEYNALPARDWQEFGRRAAIAIGETGQRLSHVLALAEKREAERAELERLRREQAERERKEHEARIAAEAAERARAEAEAKAKREADEAAARADAERRRVEQERAEAEARAARAEQVAKAAAERAEREKQTAVEAERRRAAEAKAAEEAASAKREADTRHAAKINNEVLAGLTACDLDAETGKAIIAAIVRGAIPHVKIIY